uniref:Protein kinase domain-containing protein n=1 Tax=Parascaris univalens TaxID=6257 RepID=A0A915A810_PARUN
MDGVDPPAGAGVPPIEGALTVGDALGVWLIKNKLGEGTYGAVYMVMKKDGNGEEYAMKTESVKSPFKVLKAEYYVLSELKRTKAQHFCDIIDHGLIDQTKYIVMTLVGASLGDLRKHDPTAEFHKLSLGCALSVGIKCVEAIEEIHNAGYLHRDIKPGNFAIGRINVRQVYLLDFGMSRRYRDKSLRIRDPRLSVRFRGTVRYAAMSCHLQRELCRKDDLESWLYQQVELTNGRLPWKNMTDVDEVVKCKSSCREFIKELLGGCPIEYLSVMKNIDSLGYYTTPNYAQISNYLRMAIRRNHVNEYPYDWESITDGAATKPQAIKN